ncbi:MAG: 30S ribosome-binding factor RbfA [Clostridiales bacterium]|nr:30S ribosome-binding factor RbfA [Clostridiales bacterium]
MNIQRIDRVNEEVKRHVDAILREELNDPRVKGTFSVTRAEVTRDLSYARVYISVLNDDDRADMMEALKNAAGFIRKSLGRRMIIRSAPEILFIEDRSIAYGIHIADVLKKVRAEETPDEDE